MTNTGARAGDEVVQLYIARSAGAVTRPERELKSFLRLTLEPGEMRRITFRSRSHSSASTIESSRMSSSRARSRCFSDAPPTDMVSVGSLTVVPADQKACESVSWVGRR